MKKEDTKEITEATAGTGKKLTLELGGKSPNVFFESVMAQDDAFLDKAIEGLVLFAFNQGEVCTCPSRALIQESIYEEFMARCVADSKKTVSTRTPPGKEPKLGDLFPDGL